MRGDEFQAEFFPVHAIFDEELTVENGRDDILLEELRIHKKIKQIKLNKINSKIDIKFNRNAKILSTRHFYYRRQFCRSEFRTFNCFDASFCSVKVLRSVFTDNRIY